MTTSAGTCKAHAHVSEGNSLRQTIQQSMGLGTFHVTESTDGGYLIISHGGETEVVRKA